MNGIVTATMPVTVLSIPVKEKETERSNDLLKATQLVGGSQELYPIILFLSLEVTERAQFLNPCQVTAVTITVILLQSSTEPCG